MRVLPILGLLILAGSSAAAETTTGGCPTYVLKDLIRRSDLIVVGRVLGTDEARRWITVEEVQKGRARHRTIAIAFDSSVEDCSGIEGRSQAHRFFLKRPRARGAPYQLLLAVPRP